MSALHSGRSRGPTPLRARVEAFALKALGPPPPSAPERAKAEPVTKTRLPVISQAEATAHGGAHPALRLPPRRPRAQRLRPVLARRRAAVRRARGTESLRRATSRRRNRVWGLVSTHRASAHRRPCRYLSRLHRSTRRDDFGPNCAFHLATKGSRTSSFDILDSINPVWVRVLAFAPRTEPLRF